MSPNTSIVNLVQTGKKMRIFSSLLLVVSFALGIVSAFVVAYYTFDAKPAEVVDRGPTVKILVAKKEIPVGLEIRAEDIRFTDVPVAEIPKEAITNFMQVYRRRTAYSIPVGCPICEDLLMPKAVTDAGENRFLPAGTQIVTLEIGSVRQGDVLSEPNIPIAHILQPGKKIDIHVVPENEPQGELIEKKLAVINSVAEKNPKAEAGEIVLENIEVHQVHGQAGAKNSTGRQLQAFSMILDDSASLRLAEAAKTGRLRVSLRKTNQPVQKTESDELHADAASTVKPTLTEPAVPRVSLAQPTVQPVVSRHSIRDAEKIAQTDSQRVELRQSATVETSLQPMRTTIPEAAQTNRTPVTFVSPIRQPLETERAVESSESPRQTMTATQAAPFRSRTEPRLFTVGSTIQAGKINTETNGYSPFSRSVVMDSDPSEEDAGETIEPTPPRMLRSEGSFPYRNR